MKKALHCRLQNIILPGGGRNSAPCTPLEASWFQTLDSLADKWTKKLKQIKKYLFPVHIIAVLQIGTCMAKMSFSASSSARSDQAEGWSRRCILTLEQNVDILRFPKLEITSRISLGVDTVISPWSDTLLQQNAVIPSYQKQWWWRWRGA